MIRYIAFLRGVSPVIVKNSALKRCFEGTGFTDVKTVLSSGNVAFTAPEQSETSLARQAEGAMTEHLGHMFYTIVRPATVLRNLVQSDPFTTFDLPANHKRIVTFLGEPYSASYLLPIETGDGWILAIIGGAVLSAYIPSPHGSVVMRRIERVFGSHVTTRTWETVKKCAIV